MSDDKKQKSKTDHRTQENPMHSTKKDDTSKSTDSAITLLMEDHKRVKKLFAEFKKIKDQTGAAPQKSKLVQQICKELSIHATVEEELFYPTVRAGIPDQELMDEATVEHAGAKALIAQLQEMTPGDDLYDAKVIVLSESIEHHVQEEEGEMFPQAQKAQVLTELLAAQMFQRQQDLLAEVEEPTKSTKGRPVPTANKPHAAHPGAH